jgi:two-component sensor histidine kinase/HAMP domain-containing protein
MEASDINDPFIQEHLTNSVAAFLKLQQTIMPGLYGEIFLTNKYGVMISTTGKLTTLAHSHKYWWEASYFNGKGRVFFDDRGFDESVDGYVLGVVVPIMDGNEVIGILKSNINLDGPLTNVVEDFRLNHPGNIQIARTKGLVVAEKGGIPLYNNLPEELSQYLQSKKTGSEVVEVDNRKEFIAFSSIPITLGSDEYGFGGKYESIGHIKGNEGEAWHIVITLDEAIAMERGNKWIRLLIIAGIIFIVLASFTALLLGKWFAKPLIKLSLAAQKIGEGNLDTKISLITKDEIGSLSQSVNKMTENLKKTLTSRDKLTLEVELRKEAEKRVNIQLKEKEVILKEAHHRIKNNFISISSLLSLQSSSITNSEAVSALEDAIGRVNSMALLYEKMLLGDDYNTSSVKEYLDTLVDEIVRLFPGNLNLKVEKQITDFKLDPKTLVPIGIIVNELLTNIMKYAFNDQDSCLIEVIFTIDKENVNLILQDNGRGFPEGFNIENQKGFGLRLIKMLTLQLGGSLTMDNHNGTRSVIKFSI